MPFQQLLYILSIEVVFGKSTPNLSKETMDKIRNPRFYFYEGNLLIMSVSPEHEYYNRIIASLIDILAEQFQQNWIALGSTTYTNDENLKKVSSLIRVFILQTNRKIRGRKNGLISPFIPRPI